MSNRGKWKWDDEKKCLVDYEEPTKPEVNAPYVITDEIPGGIKSMADRRYYTSKRKLRDSYRALGFIEVGNETNYTPPPEDDRKYKEQLEADLSRAYYDLRDGNDPYLTAEDRERCKTIDKNIRDYNYDNRERDEFGNVRD